MDELFQSQSLAHLTHFHKKGGLAKLMRWMSFFQVALEWKGYLFATKLILLSEKLSPNELQQEGAPEKAEGRSKTDAKKELNELKRANGFCELAPKMVTSKNFDTLNALLLMTRATWKLRAQRARELVPIESVLQNNAACSTDDLL